MQTRSADRTEIRADRPLAVQRPLLPGMPLPTRYFLGLGLLFLCLFMPAFAALFRW